jgi:hypothetical protein
MSGQPPSKKQKTSAAAEEDPIDAAIAMLLLSGVDIPDISWDGDEWEMDPDPRMEEAEEKDEDRYEEMRAQPGYRPSKAYRYDPDSAAQNLTEMRLARQFAPGEVDSSPQVRANGTTFEYRGMALRTFIFSSAFERAMHARASVLTMDFWEADDVQDPGFRKLSLVKADLAFVQQFVSCMEESETNNDWNPPVPNTREIYKKVAREALKECPIDIVRYQGEVYDVLDYDDAYQVAVNTYRGLVQPYTSAAASRRNFVLRL